MKLSTEPARPLHDARTHERFCDGKVVSGSFHRWDFKAEKICPECLAIVRWLQRQGRVRQ